MHRIALLTDFGTRDPYVAAMKGVIAARSKVPIHDLTHEIAPFDVFEAAWFLRGVDPYWAAGTIFVCVVDPGVGSERRIIAARHGERVFLAPDNGLLSLVLDQQAEVFSVENESLFLPGGSNTFHGRDRFAPVAAALAEGLPQARLGSSLRSIVRLPYEPPRYDEDRVTGSIVAVDRFGNLITDVELARLPFAHFVLEARGQRIERLERNYADAAPGPFLIAGSSGCLEISLRNDSAADHLQWKRHERVVLRAREQAD